MLGKIESNDLAESSFAGVTAQFQCYVLIGMRAAAEVSDVGRNGFISRVGIKSPIDRETTIKKTKAKEKEHELYFGMVKELQITLLITFMEDAPRTRIKNNDNVSRARKWRSKKEEAAKDKGNEDAEEEFIECMIYHRMWESEACWETVAEVTEGLRDIKTKGVKVAALKDNIRIRWKGLGWMECETRWTVDGHKLKIPELANRLKGLIRTQQKKKWVIPEKPAVLDPQQKNITFLGTETRQVGELEKKAKKGEYAI